MFTRRISIILGLVLVAFITRFIPHPPNFTAINAIALFAACTLRNHNLSLFIVFSAMFLSDLILGLHSQMFFVYASLGLTTLLGRTNLPLLGKLPASSLLFFVVVNFGVWLGDGLYPQTAAGLALCYVAAIPFYVNQLLGDLFFSFALFGLFRSSAFLFNHKDVSFSGKIKEKNHSRA